MFNEGIQTALDDFGTGYASLTHLNDFPISALKFDRSFISNLETNGQDGAIVRVVINLGCSLGIKIVAKGVETECQAKLLKNTAGFHFSQAIPALDVASLITNWGRAQEAA